MNPRRRFFVSRRLQAAICIVVAAFAFYSSPNAARARGREYSMNARDISMKIDTRWAGCGYGGYYPIRFELINRGPARNLDFQFIPEDAHSGSLPTISRTIGAEQNATVQFTLSIPVVSSGFHGIVRVVEEGEELDEFRIPFSLPEPVNAGEYRPSVVVISEVNIDFKELEAATNALLMRNANSGGGAVHVWSGSSSVYSSPYSSVSTYLDHEVVGPTMLPEKWLDYTGVDFVMCDRDTLTKLSADLRRALIEWVESGGSLVVYGVGKKASESEELEKLFDFKSRASAANEWSLPDPKNRPPVGFEDSSGRRQVIRFPLEREEGDAFAARRGLMLGKVYAIEKNAFPGEASDWYWFLSDVGIDRLLWPQRYGVFPRGTNNDFLHFLIPGVSGVPSTAFLVLITLFTLIIGPVNYIVLARKRNLYLLLLTIPAFAFVTSLSLFGYSSIAHGFGAKSRARSLTLLDQSSRTAVTTSRISLFAGMAPSQGLKFGESTAVFPIWSNSLNFDSGHIDWTQSQSLSRGWLRSRTRTQFLTESHRIERGRLELSAANSGKLKVANGLEWDIEALIVSDDSGQYYFLESLPAGASGEMSSATPGSLDAVNELLIRYPLEPPQNVYEDRVNEIELPFASHRGAPREMRVTASFAQSNMERRIHDLQYLRSRPNVLESRSYLAVLKQNPGVELGLEKTKEIAGYHLLLGYY